MENDSNEKKKTDGFDKPTIWIKFSQLAVSTGSVNLGQGFPDWQPPQFLIDSITKHVSDVNSNHQYQRSGGVVKLVETISKNYSPKFNREINPMTEVLVANGAVSVLYNIITAYIHEGDELVAIEGFYDCYRPQVLFSGGKVVGVPLIPPKPRNKSEYLNLSSVDNPNIKDRWTFDFDKLEKAFNERTRLLLLNTPHNPTGKVLTFEEMREIKKILDKFPKVILIMDEVYEHMVFDEFEEMPRFATLDGMWDRTISVMSAGKIFSATGIRIGWAIGPSHIIQKAQAIFQYNSFCLYGPLQLAVSEALENANLPYLGYENYYKWLRAHYTNLRNYFVEALARTENFDYPFWLPEGGYFLIFDISSKSVESKHKFEGEICEYTKDFNFILNTAYEKKIVCIPCSPFYTPEHVSIGENFIRLAFCKKRETLDAAIKNFSK